VVFVRETEAVVREALASGSVGSRFGEPNDSWAAGNLVGTAEQVCERIQAYVDLGCTYFVPWCADYPDETSVRVLARSVLPEFR
jgi:hypothetical protein